MGYVFKGESCVLKFEPIKCGPRKEAFKNFLLEN